MENIVGRRKFWLHFQIRFSSLLQCEKLCMEYFGDFFLPKAFFKTFESMDEKVCWILTIHEHLNIHITRKNMMASDRYIHYFHLQQCFLEKSHIEKCLSSMRRFTFYDTHWSIITPCTVCHACP